MATSPRELTEKALEPRFIDAILMIVAVLLVIVVMIIIRINVKI